MSDFPRPGPAFLDAMLFKTNSSGGVDCSADFNGLGSPTVLVQVFNHGMLVAERAGVPATLGKPILTMPDWPLRLGKLPGATPCRRGKPPFGAFALPPSAGMPPQIVMGDEFRVLAEIPMGKPHPAYYHGFEITANAGATWGVAKLETISALTRPFVVTTISPDTTITCPPVEGFGYIGAESVNGPWYDLGPVHNSVPATNAVRVIRIREFVTLLAL